MFFHLSVILFTGDVSIRGVSVQGGLCPEGPLSKGVSVQRAMSRGSLSRRNLCPEGGLCPGGSLSRGLCPGKCLSGGSLSRGSMSKGSLFRGSLSKGVSVPGVLCREGGSVQGGLCSGGLCKRGLCPGGSLSRGVSVSETLTTHPTGMHSCFSLFSNCCPSVLKIKLLYSYWSIRVMWPLS